MRLIDIHRGVQFSQTVGRVQRSMVAAMDAHRNSLAAAPNSPTSKPLVQAMRLGFVSGACAVMGRAIDRDKLYRGATSLMVGSYLTAAGSAKSAAPAMSGMTAAPLGLILLVGLGRLPHAFFDKQSPLLILRQHGLVGLPRYVLEEGYLRALDVGKSSTARACLVGSILLSVPQELVRGLMFVAVTVLAIPAAIAVGIAGCAINATRCLQSKDSAPGDYTAFKDTKRDIVKSSRPDLFRLAVHQKGHSSIIKCLSRLRLHAEAFSKMENAPQVALILMKLAYIIVPQTQASEMIQEAQDHLDQLTNKLQKLGKGLLFQDDARRFKPLFEAHRVLYELDRDKARARQNRENIWATLVENSGDAQRQILTAQALAKMPIAQREQAQQFEQLLQKLSTFKYFMNKSFGPNLDRTHLQKPALKAA